MDEREDSRLAVEKFKSGFSPPGDIPFEDLSTGGGDSSVRSPAAPFSCSFSSFSFFSFSFSF
jgi:hypothetical protein